MARSSTTFKKGQSGNPKGRPKSVAAVRELAREHTETAIDTLVNICMHGQNESARVAAANSLLDRGHGRPAQQLDVEVKRTVSVEELSDDALARVVAGEEPAQVLQ